MWLSRHTFHTPVLEYGWVRLLPLLGTVGSLWLMHSPGLHPTWWDWLVALVAAAAILGGSRWPLCVALGQCALLGYCTFATAESVSLSLGTTLVRLWACVGLGELAYRWRRPWQLWLGAAALATVRAMGPYPLYLTAANVMLVVLDVGLPVLVGSFLRSRRELAEAAEQRAAEAERTRGWEVTAARAAERAAIARELHDVVAHHVASIVLRAGVARHVVADGDPRLLEALEDVHSIGSEALADLRRLVGLLRDPDSVTDPGLLAATDLTAALNAVLDRTRQAGVRVEAELDTAVLEALDTMYRHAVLRVAQEGLTNVIKHAGSGAAVRVVVRRDGDDRLVVEVTNSAPLLGSVVGSASTPGTGPGHGLTVMRERVELLGGSLRAGPDSGGKGWVLRAELPGVVPAKAEMSGKARS